MITCQRLREVQIPSWVLPLLATTLLSCTPNTAADLTEILHVRFDETGGTTAADQSFSLHLGSRNRLCFDGTLPETQRVRLYIDEVLVTETSHSSAIIKESPSALLIGTANETYPHFFQSCIYNLKMSRENVTSDFSAQGLSFFDTNPR